ncbi:ubiquitin-conjugating enzyme/RWD-like protein, partial [Tanacetum coccineum]
TIFARVYESRMDLLRAAIIGPKGTPYHDGLFFFDVYFPRSYPKSPPRVGYHSGGLAINPKLHKNGRVRLTLPKTTDSGQMEEGAMWVPGTSNILNLLISIQNQILITKPPENFENLVVGHFRNRVEDESGENETSTTEFRNDVASCVKLLVAAFMKIGAKEAEEFLPL